MTSTLRRTVPALALVCAVALASCSSDTPAGPRAATTDTAVTSTSVDASSATEPVESSLPAETTPVTAPAETAAPDTVPAETVATTPATSPDPTADPTTGLSRPAPSSVASAAPAGLVVEDMSMGQATLSIEAGAQSYENTGYCTEIDGDTYVFVGTFGVQSATLAWHTADPASGQYLTWQYGPSSDTSLVSTHGIDRPDDGIHITFDPSGTAGSFRGWYYLVQAESFWEFEGSFSCLAAPVFILGDHPVSLLEARCSTEGVSAGGAAPSDGALLSWDLDPAADGHREADLVWRSGGVVYRTDWLVVRQSADGQGGSFNGSATGPDGVPFVVKGSFNCLNL